MVTVIEVRGDKVRLGITAPKDVPVHRKEVFDALQKLEREGASSGAPSGPAEAN